MEIGKFNGVQNFLPIQRKQNNQVTKPELKNNEVPETKIPQKQMVNAQMFLATIPNCSFKGNVQNHEMSDEEFEQKKQEIDKKINTFPDSSKKNNIIYELKCKLNKNNIDIADKIISSPKLSKIYCPS